MTPPTDIVERLSRMSDRNTRYEYDIGDYWNATEEAADEIVRLREAVRLLTELGKTTHRASHARDMGDTPEAVETRISASLANIAAVEAVSKNPVCRAALDAAKEKA